MSKREHKSYLPAYPQSGKKRKAEEAELSDREEDSEHESDWEEPEEADVDTYAAYGSLDELIAHHAKLHPDVVVSKGERKAPAQDKKSDFVPAEDE